MEQNEILRKVVKKLILNKRKDKGGIDLDKDSLLRELPKEAESLGVPVEDFMAVVMPILDEVRVECGDVKKPVIRKNDDPQSVIRAVAKEMVRRKLNLPTPNDIRRDTGNGAAQLNCSSEPFSALMAELAEELCAEIVAAIRN